GQEGGRRGQEVGVGAGDVGRHRACEEGGTHRRKEERRGSQGGAAGLGTEGRADAQAPGEVLTSVVHGNLRRIRSDPPPTCQDGRMEIWVNPNCSKCRTALSTDRKSDV